MKVCIQKDFLWVKSASNILRVFTPTSRQHLVLMLQKKNWTFWTAMHLPLHPQWTIRSLAKLKLCHAFRVMAGVQILLTEGQSTTECPLMPDQWAHNLGQSERCPCN